MDPTTMQLILQFGLPLVGLVAVVLWVRGQIEKRQADHQAEKDRLIKRLDEKDALLETKNERLETILTETVAKNTASHDKQSQSLDRLSETLSGVKCLDPQFQAFLGQRHDGRT